MLRFARKTSKTSSINGLRGSFRQRRLLPTAAAAPANAFISYPKHVHVVTPYLLLGTSTYYVCPSYLVPGTSYRYVLCGFQFSFYFAPVRLMFHVFYPAINTSSRIYVSYVFGATRNLGAS